MTKEQFLLTEINQISQVYLGMDRVCRCGCKGEYIATSFHKSPRSEVNDELVKKRLNKAKRLISEGKNFEIHDNICINIETGNNRALTFYFNEIKNENYEI